MTLTEAYVITAKMNLEDHRTPTGEQSDAKAVIYREVIHPKYSNKDGDVPPHMEPDFMEGWR